MIELICAGNGRNRLKWTSLVSKIRDQSSRHSKSKVSQLILKANNEFVDSLYGYRSRIIHDIADSGGFEYSTNIKSGKAKLNLFASRRLVKGFPELEKLSDNYRMTLLFAVAYLINKTLELLISVLLHLKEDIEINRKITIGGEISFWKNPQGEFVDASTPYWQ